MAVRTIELPVCGMDCADCAAHVQKAIANVPGVQSVNVLLSAEKAVIQVSDRASMDAIREAVAGAGYSVPEASPVSEDFSKAALSLFGIVFGVVLLIVVVGEGLGLFETITDRIPAPVGYALVLLAGYPTFRSVLRAALKRQIIAHTLMVIGVFAALLIGEWVTAAIVVFFMRVGDFAERFTTEQSRKALKNLTALAPQTARVERGGVEVELPIAEVGVGDVVIVRPGESIPVDGEVIAGQATVNQAAITGESMPIEAGAGTRVFAATIATLGSLRVRATHVGTDTTFGRVMKLVEEAETHRGEVQRLADRFAGYFLPFVAAVAALTYLFSRNPLAVAAVLVVACSCSIALATPIAVLASIGAAAKHGLLFKGGKYLETLAKADVVLLDKTGTLTLGQPQVTDVIALNGVSEREILALAASAERYSEHPLAEAVRQAAKHADIPLVEPQGFEAVPGFGIKARVGDHAVTVGSHRTAIQTDAALILEAQGKTPLYVTRDGELIGVMGAADTLRPEIGAALESLRGAGLKEIVMLTGDSERVAQGVAQKLGISYRAGLLPQDKIEVVRAYQHRGAPSS
jgi:P-type Cu+ transporter